MAEANRELQTKLAELEQELAEGDITRKGYEKRKTMLFTEYLDSGQPGYSSGQVAHRNQSTLSGNGASYDGRMGVVENAGRAFSSMGAPPRSQATRFQERHLGVRNNSHTRSLSGPDSLLATSHSDDSSGYDDSRTPTMSRADYAFNPADQVVADGQPPTGRLSAENSRMSTMLDSQQRYFQDFTGHQREELHRESYGGPQRYSMGEALLSTTLPAALQADVLPTSALVNHQMPLEPRDIPFNIFDPHDRSVQMSKFESIGAVLRYRGKTNAKQPAYWVLDPKGKETTSITWEKLASKAEKVAQVIKDKSNLYRGDRVALVYRDSEVIEFAVALLGCFIAGVVAVPVNCIDDYHKLTLLLTTTQAHLALTTDNNLKTFHRDITTNRLKWPTGVEWWKTNEFGSYHHKKKDDAPTLQVPDLAYIEFSRAPTGDLRGVVLSHRTIMHQMACVSAVIAALPRSPTTDIFGEGFQDRNAGFVAPGSRHGEIILSYLDPREGVGMILGVLLGVYGGHTTVWMESRTVDTAGLYAHLITKYRATVMVGDYSRLKFAAYNYQQDPMTTRQFKKGMEPNFSSVKICLIDTLTVDCEFHEILADRWFKPMRNERAREVVAPMLCLPEHGGMIISVRDWLGGEERMGCPLSLEEAEEEAADSDGEHTPDASYSGYSLSTGTTTSRKTTKKQSRTDLSEVLLDKEALKTNEVVVVAVGEDARRRAHESGTIRAGAFGYPIPDATLAVVDPETTLLCSPFTIGEIWVDSPSLSGGFWSLPKHTDTIFHARPYNYAEGNPTPVLLDLEFLRTGLLGCIIEGKVYILGLYEDRIRQKVEWVEHGVYEAEHRYFFVQHLVSSIMRNIPKIHDWQVNPLVTANG